MSYAGASKSKGERSVAQHLPIAVIGKVPPAGGPLLFLGSALVRLRALIPGLAAQLYHAGTRASGQARRFGDALPPTQIKVVGENDAERRGAKVEIPACPCCGGPMRIIERFEGPGSRRYPACKPDGW